MSESVTLSKGKATVFFTYFSFSGLAVGLIIAHAQWFLKVGEEWTIIIIPTIMAFILAYSNMQIQKFIERAMKKKIYRSSKRKAARSVYLFNSRTAEVLLKTAAITIGGFLGVYFGLSFLIYGIDYAASKNVNEIPALINFLLCIFIATVIILVYPSWRWENRGRIAGTK
ncbi:MAG: hypothetical protein ACTSWN_07225 [Promethearchaeota archaeon]